MTVEFAPAGKGCRMVMTEQGVFLDGHDIPANHEGGWNQMLDNLGEEVEARPRCSVTAPRRKECTREKDMRLYCGDGPNSYRVRIFMAEKGIEVPQVHIDFEKGEHRSADF